MGNNFRVGFLMILLTALFVVIGKLCGGPSGMIIALLIAVVMNFGTYWFSSSIVLRMVKAYPAEGTLHGPYLKMIDDMAHHAGIPVPRLYIVPDPSPNAFATGRNPEHAIVALNQGILELLDKRELEGVIAHEMGHIIHRDILTSAIVATMAGAIMTIVDMARWSALFSRNDDDSHHPGGILLSSIFAPVAAMLIQLAVSRSREYEADKTSAMLTGSPRGLISALMKLENGVKVIPGSIAPSQAHMCIVNPFAGRAGNFLMNLFSSHPPIEQRIERLVALENSIGLY